MNIHKTLKQNISKMFFVIQYNDTSKSSYTMIKWDLFQGYKDSSTSANQRATPD